MTREHHSKMPLLICACHPHDSTWYTICACHLHLVWYIPPCACHPHSQHIGRYTSRFECVIQTEPTTSNQTLKMHKTANHNSTQHKINKRTYSDINLHVLHEDEIQHHGYSERRSVLRRGVPGVTSLCDSHKTLLAYDQEEASERMSEDMSERMSEDLLAIIKICQKEY